MADPESTDLADLAGAPHAARTSYSDGNHLHRPLIPEAPSHDPRSLSTARRTGCVSTRARASWTCSASASTSRARRRAATAEDIGTPERLHPTQAAFIAQDGCQRGYRTPGQIVSGVALLDEAKAGVPSVLDLSFSPTSAGDLSDDEISERMAGNICRCGAYPGIRAAIHEAAEGKGHEAWAEWPAAVCSNPCHTFPRNGRAWGCRVYPDLGKRHGDL